jgi:isopentenyldiphosphate isomerase
MGAAQDDGELFDLYAEDGSPLGDTKARSLVHRDGDWHRSLHVWVVLREAGLPPRVLLQRRSAGKDTWPRAVDVAVGGHYRAGEATEDTLREAEEEIGLPLRASDVVRLGLRRRADARAPGLIDNELQDIFATFTARPLLSLRPAPEEVEALIALPVGAFERLLAGDTPSASGEAIFADGAGPSAVDIALSDLIPAPDGYYRAVMRSIAAHLAGERPEPWTLG